jgi:hypothetical protein
VSEDLQLIQMIGFEALPLTPAVQEISFRNVGQGIYEESKRALFAPGSGLHAIDSAVRSLVCGSRARPVQCRRGDGVPR